MKNSDNALYFTGIIPYFKGSLEFSIIGSKLFLQSGAAYDDKGALLQLKKQSYEVLDNIDLNIFENHKKYYFYIASATIFNRLNSKEFLIHKKLEEGIYFFITIQHCESCVLLAEVAINYDMGNEQGIRTIAIPHNAFMVRKNEINIKNVHRYYLLPSPITRYQRDQISAILLDFSKIIYQRMIKSGTSSLSVISHAFFHFSDQVSTEKLSPEMLYNKFKNHTNLFSWLDYNAFSNEEVKYFKKIDDFFTNTGIKYKFSFYHIDLESPENLLFQVLKEIEQLTKVLHLQDIKKEDNIIQHIEEIPEINFSEDISLERVVQENVTVVEETSDEEEDSTVLLGETNRYIQVGRGTQSGNDIIIGENDKTVSRIHLRITPHKQGFFIEDLSSMGTYVDNERIEKNVKKFVTAKSRVLLGKKNCILDLYDYKIQALLKK